MSAAGVLNDYYPMDAAISQADLGRIMSDHERYLARKKGSRARLRAAKLDGLMMAGRDLSEADLTGASLVGANLSGADLTRASLYCADLRDCDLSYARLEHADLRGASFNGAKLAHAVLDHADLRAATMLHMGDTLRFQGNAHVESPFGAVDFSHSSLRHASFRNAKLDNANFTDALLEGASFRGARLRNACFRGTALAGVDLADLNTSSPSLQHSVKAPTPQARERAKTLLSELTAHHEWFISGGRRGKPATLDGEDLRPLGHALTGLCLAGLSAKNTIAISVDFSGCQLQAAKFDGADVRGASFVEADLSGTSFHGAKIGHASFRNARIEDLHLRSGQVLPFQADVQERTMRHFGEAQIRSDAFFAELPQGSC